MDCAKFDGTPWPVEYLTALGVDPVAIRLVVASHWHSDHVDGISELVRHAIGARFVCSRAIRCDEFQSLIACYADSTDLPTMRAPLKEITQTFGIIEERLRRSMANAPRLAGEKQILWQTPDGRIDVWALSPSDADVMASLVEFKKLFIPEGEPLRGISPIRQNESCVVVAVRVDQQWILLGSDLEVTGTASTGWNAIVGAPLAQLKPASVYKLAHHGSTNGFSPVVWNALLDPKAITVVTPYSRSRLPRQEQIEIMKAQGREIYITARHQAQPARRAASATRMIERQTTAFQPSPAPPDFGFVRMRKNPTSPNWGVELFGAAARL